MFRLTRAAVSCCAVRRLGDLANAPPGSTLVFDLDGTLVETAPDLASAVNVLLRELGRPEVTLAQTKHFIGDGMAKLTERALDATGGAPACVDELAALFARCDLTTHPFQLFSSSRPSAFTF